MKGFGGAGGIARAAWVAAAGILFSRVLGFARNVVLANRLGDSSAADAYEAAFILPDFLNYLLAGGFLAITFIPVLSRYLAADDRAGAQEAFNAVFRPAAVLIVVLTGAAAAGAETIVGWMFGTGDRLDAAWLAEVTRLTRMVLPAQVFFVLGGLFTAVQYAHGRFLIPALAPIIYNAGIILGGLAGGLSGGEGSASGFIIGAVGGALAGNLALQWWGARRTGLRITPGLPDFRHPAFREYLVLAVPLMVGQSIVVLDESLGKVVASAASDGAVFSLNLARRVNMLPVGVIAQAAGVAAYPYLARLLAEGRRREMAESMGRTLRMVMFVSGAAAAGVIAVSQPAVRAAFQHGEFSEAGTVLTAAALVGYSLSIPAWGIHQIFARSFYAHRQMWIPVIAGTAWTIPAVPLFLAGFRLGGAPGVAVASSIALTGHALTLWLLWRRFHTSEGLEGALPAVLRAALAAAGAAFAGQLAADAVAGGVIPGFGAAVTAAAAGLAVSGAVYLAAAALIGSTEARSVLRRRWPTRS